MFPCVLCLLSSSETSFICYCFLAAESSSPLCPCCQINPFKVRIRSVAQRRLCFLYLLRLQKLLSSVPLLSNILFQYLNTIHRTTAILFPPLPPLRALLLCVVIPNFPKIISPEASAPANTALYLVLQGDRQKTTVNCSFSYYFLIFAPFKIKKHILNI